MEQVLFFSRGGNTKKVADAISDELGIKAYDIRGSKVSDGSGAIFLGSGCYGGRPAPDMMDLIEINDLDDRKVALFGTSGGGHGRELDEMEGAVKRKEAKVLGRFTCKGRTFIFLNRGHPDDVDLTRSREFAREMAGKG